MSKEGASTGEGDRYLIASIQKGDETAFRQLVDRYSGRLNAYASRKLGRGNPEAEDAVQDTFVGLLENLHRLTDVRSLEAYLFTILKNKVVDQTRRSPRAHGQIPVAFGKSDSGRGWDPPARDETPSQAALKKEERSVRRKVLADILDEALEGFKKEKSFRDLKIVELFFYGGYRGKEIAQLVGTSEPTVTRTKTEALERLARLVRRHPMGDPALGSLEDTDESDGVLSEVWRENLLSCLKRSTLGAYTLNVGLDSEWRDYIAFHLDVIKCEACLANLDDIRTGEKGSEPLRERVFTSSVGFLRRKR